MDKRFWAVIGVIAVVFVGVIWYNNSKQSSGSSTAVSGTTNHVEGTNTKGVKVVEYGDFQCPTCGLYYPIVKQVVEKYKGDIQFQFRNFPLTNLHPNAFAAARAAEAADKQGKYWEMHDILYQNQNSWSGLGSANGVFEQYAKQIGLDVSKYQTDFKSEAVNNSIRADQAEADRLKLTGTPSFVINDRLYENSSFLDDKGQPTVEKFSSVIDKAIKDAEASKKQ